MERYSARPRVPRWLAMLVLVFLPAALTVGPITTASAAACATPTAVTASDNGNGSSATVSWTPAGACSAFAIYAYAYPPGSPSGPIVSVHPSSDTIGGLTGGNSYVFTVTGFDSVANAWTAWSGWSAWTPIHAGGGCGVLDTVQVPGSGSPVTFATALDQDGSYLLKATGSVSVGSQMVDAEYAFTPGGTPSDMLGGVDIGIDTGMLWPNRPMRFTQVPPSQGRMKWNPQPQIDASNNVTPGAGFRADSTYYMIVIGAGRPLTLHLVLPAGTTGSGAIAVSLYRLSPPPPAHYVPMHSTNPAPPPPPQTCGTALDTVDVSVLTAAIVPSTFTTDASKLYLLQASGTAPTGAAGLGDGDAEFMDFGDNVSVNGYNDGESCADFGLGVNETTVTHCHVNTTNIHRKWWWGTVGIAPGTTQTFSSPFYRNDHIYYMIFPGTGKPLSYVYFDSGYGDNQNFDVMVRTFPLP